ncbi:hypothetical protein THAOC_23388, partial [Thalassiosira oceanica]
TPWINSNSGLNGSIVGLVRPGFLMFDSVVTRSALIGVETRRIVDGAWRCSDGANAETLEIAESKASVLNIMVTGNVHHRIMRLRRESGEGIRHPVLKIWRERQEQLERLGHHLAGPTSAVAPYAILGGASAVFTSAISRSDNADITPLSMFYLLLLALNYAVTPRLGRLYIHPSTNKQSVALVEEVVKMSLGLGGWVLSSYVAQSSLIEDASSLSDRTVQDLSRQLSSWSFTSTLLAAGLPSALYAIQGTLQYTAYQHLDSVTFNGLVQFKVLTSALCCYILLGKRQSPWQCVSLGLLLLSNIIFQGTWKSWRKGAQRCLQQQVDGMQHRNAYFYTVEISALSATYLIASMAANWIGGEVFGDNKQVKAIPRERGSGFFHDWSHKTFIPVAMKATAGLLTALVHQHLGSVVKGFALVLGLIFSALLQLGLEGTELTFDQMIGTALRNHCRRGERRHQRDQPRRPRSARRALQRTPRQVRRAVGAQHLHPRLRLDRADLRVHRESGQQVPHARLVLVPRPARLGEHRVGLHLGLVAEHRQGQVARQGERPRVPQDRVQAEVHAVLLVGRRDHVLGRARPPLHPVSVHPPSVDPVRVERQLLDVPPAAPRDEVPDLPLDDAACDVLAAEVRHARAEERPQAQRVHFDPPPAEDVAWASSPDEIDTASPGSHVRRALRVALEHPPHRVVVRAHDKARHPVGVVHEPVPGGLVVVARLDARGGVEEGHDVPLALGARESLAEGAHDVGVVRGRGRRLVVRVVHGDLFSRAKQAVGAGRGRVSRIKR